MKFYSNLNKHKLIIFKENNKKTGIYKWTNLVTGKSYVGSAVNLTERFKDYYSEKRLRRIILKSRSLIYSSILKYGYSNFNLEVLEYCKPIDLIQREQYYLDLLKPEYNICKTAGSTLGRKHSEITKIKLSIASKGKKHTPETILKIKSYKHTPEVLLKLKSYTPTPETIAKLKIYKPSSLNIIRTKLALSFKIIITNITDNSIIEYYSIREASRNLNISHTTIRNYIKSGKIYNNKYLFNIK